MSKAEEKALEKYLLLADKVPSCEEQKEFMNSMYDSILNSFKEMLKGDKYVVMLLYLWISTATGISLREAVERYSIVKDFDDSRNPFEVKNLEYTLTLRENLERIHCDPSKFNEFQMETAKFLQDIIENLNKRK